MAETIVRVRPEKLEEHRYRLGLSIAGLAVRAEVAKSTVWKAASAEAGSSDGHLGMSKASRIASALGLDVRELFTHTNGDDICRVMDSSSTARS